MGRGGARAVRRSSANFHVPSGQAGARSGRQSADPLGNRQQVTDSVQGTTTYTANNLNQYSTISGEPAPAYDSNGNLTGRAGWVYTYDAQNRLVEADGTLAGTGNRMTFAYDGLNRCVSRHLYQWDGSVWQAAWNKYFVYDGWSLVAEYDAPDADEPAFRYVHGPIIDEILARFSPGGTTYYHHDGLGSTVALTDESGAALEAYRYDAFGRPHAYDSLGNPLTTSAYQNRFLFTGREWLTEVTLYDYRHRTYDTAIGRFMQTDPIRFSGLDANLYRYVANNLIDSEDPWGLARRGSRPLDAKVPFNGLGPVRHDQIWYDDGSNSGFFDTDDIRPDTGHSCDEYDFSRDPTHYDDELMHEAERRVQEDWDMDWRMPLWNPWDWNNCQDYVDAVIDEYGRVEDDRNNDAF